MTPHPVGQHRPDNKVRTPPFQFLKRLLLTYLAKFTINPRDFRRTRVRIAQLREKREKYKSIFVIIAITFKKCGMKVQKNNRIR